MKTAVNGDVIYVQNLTGTVHSTPYTETIIAGGQSRNYVVTTKTQPISGGNGNVLKSNNGKLLKDSTGKVIKTQ